MTMENWTTKQKAVFEYFDKDESLIEDINELDIDTDEVTINGENLFVLTDDEAEDRYEQELDWYIEQCIMPEIPKYLQYYFDEESWKRDTRIDWSRGRAIASYDEDEHEFNIDEEWIYIYRVG